MGACSSKDSNKQNTSTEKNKRSNPKKKKGGSQTGIPAGFEPKAQKAGVSNENKHVAEVKNENCGCEVVEKNVTKSERAPLLAVEGSEQPNIKGDWDQKELESPDTEDKKRVSEDNAAAQNEWDEKTIQDVGEKKGQEEAGSAVQKEVESPDTEEKKRVSEDNAAGQNEEDEKTIQDVAEKKSQEEAGSAVREAKTNKEAEQKAMGEDKELRKNEAAGEEVAEQLTAVKKEKEQTMKKALEGEERKTTKAIRNAKKRRRKKRKQRDKAVGWD